MKRYNEPADVRKIRSMDALKREQSRLRRELEISEEKIRGDYHDLLNAFTFANLFQLAVDELTRTSATFAQAFEVGRSLFKRKKKKKKLKSEEPLPEPEPLLPSDQE